MAGGIGPEFCLTNEDCKSLARLAMKLADAHELALCPSGLQGAVAIAIQDTIREIEKIRNPNRRPFDDDRRNLHSADDVITLGALECLFATHDEFLRWYGWETHCTVPADEFIELSATEFTDFESWFQNLLEAEPIFRPQIDHLRTLAQILSDSASRDHEDGEAHVTKGDFAKAADYEGFDQIKVRIKNGEIPAREDPKNNKMVYVRRDFWHQLLNGQIDLRRRKVSRRERSNGDIATPNKVRVKSG